jgi:hypothetical protein
LPSRVHTPHKTNVPRIMQMVPKMAADTTEHILVAFIPVKRVVRRMAVPAHLREGGEEGQTSQSVVVKRGVRTTT